MLFLFVKRVMRTITPTIDPYHYSIRSVKLWRGSSLIYNHMYTNNLLYRYQSGFLPGHSTTFQLIDINHTFDSIQFSCMVFCDISKAFDRVWHEGLIFNP